MNLNKQVLLLLISLVSLQTIQADTDDIIKNDAVEMNVISTDNNSFDYIDKVSQEFEEFELERMQETVEPPWLQKQTTSLGIALLMKYIEVQDFVSDCQDTLGKWWHALLVYCHIKNAEKNAIDESNKS